MHVDPGPFWDWHKYMSLISAPSLQAQGDLTKSVLVTIAPTWSNNKQVVTGCTSGSTSCVPAGLQSANFVYLRTEPRSDAPLIKDPVLGQGTTEISNNAARLFYGQTFALAELPKIGKDGVWCRVWQNGITGWFYSPWNAPTAYPKVGKTITPKPGVSSIPVYGRPIPERSEYPADLIATPPGSWFIPAPTPLPYTVAAGQRYSVIDSDVPTDHFYAWAIDSSFPYDHTVFKGGTKYIQISLGNRLGFVKTSDVIVK